MREAFAKLLHAPFIVLNLYVGVVIGSGCVVLIFGCIVSVIVRIVGAIVASCVVNVALVVVKGIHVINTLPLVVSVAVNFTLVAVLFNLGNAFEFVASSAAIAGCFRVVVLFVCVFVARMC